MRRTFLGLIALLTAAVATPAVGAGTTLRCGGLEVTIRGTRGPDSLLGTRGDDVIHGRGSHDTLGGNGGFDTICGGGGRDDLASGRADVAGSNDARRDHLYGGAGPDFIEASLGDDLVFGGDGVDWVWYANAPGPVEVNVGAGNATGMGNDSLKSIENVKGGTFDDVLYGSSVNNILSGASGNDSLRGGEGDDLLAGNSGDDDIDGEGGTDHADGYDGTDTCIAETQENCES